MGKNIRGSLFVVSAVMVLALIVTGCSGGSTTNVSQVTTISSHSSLWTPNPIDPEFLQKFGTPLPIPPVATPVSSTTGIDFYELTARQGTYDFGLRWDDGSEILDSKTGQPIRTTTWGYGGAAYLGPTIEALSTLPANTIHPGKKVVVHWANDLRDSSGKLLTKHFLPYDPTVGSNMASLPQIRIVPHLHGGHTQAEFDGYPENWFTNDPDAPANGMGGPAGNTVDYTYDNDQHATTLWYHDHAMGITRLNVYAGLAAFYILRDDYEYSLNLPSGAYEVPVVIQDKSFYENGSLAYNTSAIINPYTGLPMLDDEGNEIPSIKPEFFGNVVVVNGKAWPYLEVEPRRYRFRILNGSDSRFYNLWLSTGLSMTQIGNEGGFLPAAVSIGDSSSTGLLLAPAERADVIIDFTGLADGTKIVLRNDAAAPYPDGDSPNPMTTGKIMQFRVKSVPGSPADTSAATAFRPVTPLPAPDNTRVLDLQEKTDIFGAYYDPTTDTIVNRLEQLLNGRDFSDPVTETPELNTVEDWVIINDTGDVHPIHLHLVEFQVLEKGTVTGYVPADPASGTMPTYTSLTPDPALLDPNEAGWKETVRVPNNNGVQRYVKVRARFDRPGRYVWHCHILSHEDHEMMRPFQVVP